MRQKNIRNYTHKFENLSLFVVCRQAPILARSEWCNGEYDYREQSRKYLKINSLTEGKLVACATRGLVCKYHVGKMSV